MSVCFIDYDGKTVLKWDMVLGGGILLEDGRHIPDGKHEDRIFAVHPDVNKNIEKIDGIYHYKGRSMKGSP
jgi:hypothetical protein